MPIPLPSATNPILYHERTVWIKGVEYDIPYSDARRALNSVIGSGSQIFAAGNTFELLNLYQPAGPALNLRLVRVELAIRTCSVASVLTGSLRWTIAAPTGGVALTPRSMSPNGPAPSALVMRNATSALPAVQINQKLWNLGVTGAASLVNPPPPLETVLLFDAPSFSKTFSPLPYATLNAARGWNICMNSTGAATVVYEALMFWEETLDSP